MAKKAAAKKKTTRRAKTSEDEVNQLFKELSEKFAEATPQPYRMNGEYPVNIAIEHPKFGLGYVFASAPQKIDVAFKDTNRSLVQNRK
jgi:hypothetical protein